MNKKYLLLAGIIIALGIGMLFMPAQKDDKQLKPELLLAAIDDPSRFLTTDDVTDRLVKKDPALLLIDVRSASQFNAFAIPGAINIPVDSLLSSSALELLEQNEKDKVFCSNAGVTSDQAWIIAKRIGMQRIYVMKGGVNHWFNTIVKAKKPADTEPSEAFRQYSFRKAACQFFYGNPETGKFAGKQVRKKENIVVKKSTGKSSGGGC